MKICTYNIWNDETNYSKRMDLLIKKINEKNIDIIALQEVKNKEIVNKIKEECGFNYICWEKYHDREEGLAILSKYEMTNKWTNWSKSTIIHNSRLMCINTKVNGKILSIMNVHLDWESMQNREIELLKAIDYLKSQDTDYKIMLGDFNSYQDSRTYRFMTKLEPLDGRMEYWIDLAEAYCIRNNKPLEVTLDFINNPRWKDVTSLERPGRFDWIMLHGYYKHADPKLYEYEVIGKEIVNGITPSDHYGIVIGIDF